MPRDTCREGADDDDHNDDDDDDDDDDDVDDVMIGWEPGKVADEGDTKGG